MNITIRQIEAFLAVAQLGGFTRAAERIHLTQSGISVLIRELEVQLKVRLFDRTTRAVQLTEAGKEFFPFAEKAMAELQTALDNTQDLLAKKRGRLILAAPPLIASHLLPPVVAKFREKYSGVTIVLKDLLADEILLRVRSGEVDFGIGTFHRLDDELTSTSLIADSLILVCPKGHPLAKKRRVNWKDLAGHPLISLDRHSSLRHLVDSTLEAAGCLDVPAHEVSFITTAIGMVEAGLGIAVLPSYVLLSTRHSNVNTHRIAEPTVSREISIISKRGRSLSPAAESFTDFARQYIKSSLSLGRLATGSRAR